MYFRAVVCVFLMSEIFGHPVHIEEPGSEEVVRSVRSPHLLKKKHHGLLGGNYGNYQGYTDNYYPHPQQPVVVYKPGPEYNHNVGSGSFAGSAAFAGSSGHGGGAQAQSQSQSQSSSFGFGPFTASFSQSQSQSQAQAKGAYF